MILIGLTGVARSGKDSIADYLMEQHSFEKRSFAAPLKQMLRRLDPIIGWEDLDNSCSDPDCCGGPWPSIQAVHLSDLDMTDEEIKDSDYADEHRRLIQRLGTDCVRAVDEGFWVRAAMAALDNEQGRYVFTDCRFPNEAASIQRADGYLWWVTRPGYAAVNAHVSEQHAGRMDEDEFIHNNGTLQDLYKQVDSHMDRLAPAPTKE